MSPEPHSEAAPRPPVPKRLALFLATGAGSGYSPVASGTAGSAVALPLFVGLAALGPLAFLIVVVLLLGAGIWAAGAAERIFEQKDDGRIVIDEIVGQLLTLGPLAVFPGLWPASPRALLLWLVTGFVLFRVLDIWKPGPVRRMERELPGGAGVMMDDVLAGLIGAVPLGLAAWIARALA